MQEANITFEANVLLARSKIRFSVERRLRWTNENGGGRGPPTPLQTDGALANTFV